jgi:hypothetical protein
VTWFRLEDSFGDHPKVLRAGNAATGLWVRCASWSARQLTDGRIPRSIVESYGTRAEVERLSRVALWVEVDDEFLIPDWHEFNPTSSEVRERRAEAAERMRKLREERRRSDGRFG